MNHLPENNSLTNIYVLLLPEGQSRGGTPQQNAETWKDFRTNAKTNVLGPQKIEVFRSIFEIKLTTLHYGHVFCNKTYHSQASHK